MNTRLEIDIDLSSSAVTACYRPPPPVPALPPLKLRPSERQPRRQRPRGDRVRRVRQLLADHTPRIAGHRAPENALVQRRYELLGVRGCWSHRIEGDRDPREPAGGERDGP